MLNASDPESGSVIACTPMRSPEISPGRYACFCAGVPNFTSGSCRLHICAFSEKMSPLS
jgi:hypothetical protein